jgi:uncharacterized protein (TIGR02145 family)
MKLRIIMALTAIASISLSAQTDSIADIEGNVYHTVQIGTQWWMAENLRVTRFANGDSIPYLKDATDWAATEAGAYCFYDNRSSFSETYGNLYNWYVAGDERGVCPAGWHVPSDEEWITMEMHLGMSAEEALRMTAWRGTDEGDQVKSESFGGNNSSGFSALATGYRDPEGIYKAMGTDNDYWTSTPYENQMKTEGVLHGLLNSKSSMVRNFHVPGYGFCIRCVADHGVQVENQTDRPDTIIFPNPAGDQLFIGNAEGNNLVIQTLSGQTVLVEWEISSNHYVDISGLSEGAYLLSLAAQDNIQVTRLIKL